MSSPATITQSHAVPIVQIEISPHGPQWQKRVRFAIGQPGEMRGHGTAYVSNEIADRITRALLKSDQPCTVVDRSGPQVIRYSTPSELTRA